MIKTIFSSLILLGGSLALAGEPVDIRSKTISLLSAPLVINEGETKTVALSESWFVRKLFIQAVGTTSQGGYVEVGANGDVKGTLYLPGQDPHYVVTVEQNTKSIEFTTIRGTAKIIAIKAVVSESGSAEPLPISSHSKMGKLSLDAIWTVNKLETYSNYKDYGTFLLPIRKAGARAYAIAEAQGDASGSARPYYEQLLAALDHAKSYLNDTFEVQEAFDSAVRLLVITEKIRVLLH